MTDPTLLPTIERILDGIDRTEDTPGGWWETSTGAEHGAIARAALASPPATEERCGFPDCGGVRDDVFHEPCLTGGVFHDVKTCHPFTPSAPEPSAALCPVSVLRPDGQRQFCVHRNPCPDHAAVRAEGLDGAWEEVARLAAAHHNAGAHRGIVRLVGPVPLDTLFTPEVAESLRYTAECGHDRGTGPDARTALRNLAQALAAAYRKDER